MGKKDRLKREKQEAALEGLRTASSGLPSFQLKMERARKHLETLDYAVKDWMEVNSDLVGEETDPETGDELIVVEPPAVPPSDAIALIAADCVHNLRASLDQLVFSLAWAYTAGPLTKEVAEGCEFPVYGPRAPTARDLRKRIGAVHPDAQTVIQDLQPHKGGDSFASHELWILNQLWNLDKHRTLPLTVFGQQAIMFSPSGGPFEVPSGTELRVAGPIHRKTETIRFPAGSPKREGDMKRAIVLDVAFGKGSPAYGHPVFKFLTGLADYVQGEVIGKLTPFLD